VALSGSKARRTKEPALSCTSRPRQGAGPRRPTVDPELLRGKGQLILLIDDEAQCVKCLQGAGTVRLQGRGHR